MVIGNTRLFICIAISALLWIVPVGEALPLTGWHIFSIFIGVIISFILRPYPMAVMVLLGLLSLVATNTITIKDALNGYGDTTVWLVVAAFLIAGAVIKTGLGKRIALNLVVILGKSTIGLGYALCIAELILGPVVPSNTARGGGILAPIMKSLAYALGSRENDQPKKAGQYLALVGAHANLITSAMFLTGMAANPLVAKAAKEVMDIDFDWATWAAGAILPGLLGLFLLPLLIHFIAKPDLKDGRAAQEQAREELRKMGVWSKNEKYMGFVFILLVVLWSTKFLTGLHTTTVAWMGVCTLLLTGTQKWMEMAENKKAWDTMIWLGGLLTLANLLKTHGFIGWFADNAAIWVEGWGGLITLLLLALIYFFSMYFFSMLTAHIAAMATVFIALAMAGGAPLLLTVALFAYFSNLCASLTYYSTGPVVIYYGMGYVKPKKWFETGFIVAVFHLAIWLGPGLAWWKLLGWW